MLISLIQRGSTDHIIDLQIQLPPGNWPASLAYSSFLYSLLYSHHSIHYRSVLFEINSPDSYSELRIMLGISLSLSVSVTDTVGSPIALMAEDWHWGRIAEPLAGSLSSLSVRHQNGTPPGWCPCRFLCLSLRPRFHLENLGFPALLQMSRVIHYVSYIT